MKRQKRIGMFIIIILLTLLVVASFAPPMGEIEIKMKDVQGSGSANTKNVNTKVLEDYYLTWATVVPETESIVLRDCPIPSSSSIVINFHQIKSLTVSKVSYKIFGLPSLIFNNTELNNRGKAGDDTTITLIGGWVTP